MSSTLCDEKSLESQWSSFTKNIPILVGSTLEDVECCSSNLCNSAFFQRFNFKISFVALISFLLCFLSTF